METIPHWFGAPTTAQRLHSAPSSDPGFQPTSERIWTRKCGGNGMMTDPHLHPLRMSNTIYMFGEDVETIPHWFGAPTTAQRLHSAPSSDQGFQLTFQIWVNMCVGYGMMMDPYPHPQHMKVAKHLVYMWSRCGNRFTWVWSLNHCTEASFSTKQ